MKINLVKITNDVRVVKANGLFSVVTFLELTVAFDGLIIPSFLKCSLLPSGTYPYEHLRRASSTQKPGIFVLYLPDSISNEFAGSSPSQPLNFGVQGHVFAFQSLHFGV